MSGTGIRNQIYNRSIKHSGVTGAGNNVRAPDYLIAAAEAAFPYGKTYSAKKMPRAHGEAYEAQESPTCEEVDSLIAIMTTESSA